LKTEEDTIIIGEQTYRLSEQSDQFRRLAPHLKQVRRMLKERHNEIAVLVVSRDSLRNALLELAGEEPVSSDLSALPETISFEDAD
jgi:hypothetical protein